MTDDPNDVHIISRESLQDSHELFQFLEFVNQMRAQHPPEAMVRLEGLLESILSRESTSSHPDQRPSLGLFPGLTAKPWWSADDAPSLRQTADVLEASYAPLREELLANVPSKSDIFHPTYDGKRYSALDAKDWTSCVLYSDDEFTDLARARFPRAMAVLSQIQPHLIGEAVYLSLRPGATLPRHTDLTNAQLTCHLGMIVPPGCAIEVAGETRTWVEGQVLMFDHSFVHTAWNRSDLDRFVLCIDLVHPDLTELEVEVLKAGAHYFTKS